MRYLISRLLLVFCIFVGGWSAYAWEDSVFILHHPWIALQIHGQVVEVASGYVTLQLSSGEQLRVARENRAGADGVELGQHWKKSPGDRCFEAQIAYRTWRYIFPLDQHTNGLLASSCAGCGSVVGTLRLARHSAF